MFTDESISFTRLEDLGLDDLTPLIQMAALPYRGPLLTDCTEIEGEGDDIFVDTLTVGEIHQIEEILLGGDIGIGYVYKDDASSPAAFLLNLNPINAANFLAKNLPACKCIRLTDLYARIVYEVQKDSTNGTLHHRCQNSKFTAELLEHLDPILKHDKKLENFPCVSIDKYDFYLDSVCEALEGISPAGFMMVSLLAYAKADSSFDLATEKHLTVYWKIGNTVYSRSIENVPNKVASYIQNRAKEGIELLFKTDSGETVIIAAGGYVFLSKDSLYLRTQLLPAIHAIAADKLNKHPGTTE